MAIDATVTGDVAGSSDQAAPPQKPKLLSLMDAQARLLAGLPLMPAEKASLDRACGRVSGDDIMAILSYPPVPLSAMDGYACRSADTTRLPVCLRRIGVSRAGTFSSTLEVGSLSRARRRLLNCVCQLITSSIGRFLLVVDSSFFAFLQSLPPHSH